MSQFKLKSTTKRLFQRVALHRGEQSIVLASTGRAGSTLLFEAIVRSISQTYHAGLRWPIHRICQDSAWNLSALAPVPGVVYKTHDLPWAAHEPKNTRVIFVFGSAIETVRSVQQAWEDLAYAFVESHFNHMKATGPVEALADRDVLGLETKIDAWLSHDSVPTLCIKYESLWEKESTISDFLNLDISLPEQRQRSEKTIDPKIDAKIVETYSPIERKIDRLPAVQIKPGA